MKETILSQGPGLLRSLLALLTSRLADAVPLERDSSRSRDRAFDGLLLWKPGRRPAGDGCPQRVGRQGWGACWQVRSNCSSRCSWPYPVWRPSC